jgi:hypothetical protein
MYSQTENLVAKGTKSAYRENSTESDSYNFISCSRNMRLDDLNHAAAAADDDND